MIVAMSTPSLRRALGNKGPSKFLGKWLLCPKSLHPAKEVAILSSVGLSQLGDRDFRGTTTGSLDISTSEMIMEVKNHLFVEEFMVIQVVAMPSTSMIVSGSVLQVLTEDSF